MLIIDDVVGKETQDLIENYVFSVKPQWTLHLNYNMPIRVPYVSPEMRPQSMFFNIIKPHTFRLDREEYSLLIEPVKQISSKFFKVRCVMSLPVTSHQTSVATPHLDADAQRDYNVNKFRVGIYYVSDSESPTTIYKDTHASVKEKGITDKDINNGVLEIDTIVEAKKGRLVVLDGDVFHSSGIARTKYRSIINYNFE
jgi:hypothetical protein